MSYSSDLRKKVINFLDLGGKKVEAIKLFQISPNCIYRWIKNIKDSGRIEDNPPIRNYRKINPHTLILYVEANPNKTLKDYANEFQVSDRELGQAFKKLKITRKKRLIYIENEMKPNVMYFWQLSKESLKKI